MAIWLPDAQLPDNYLQDWSDWFPNYFFGWSEWYKQVFFALQWTHYWHVQYFGVAHFEIPPQLMNHLGQVNVHSSTAHCFTLSIEKLIAREILYRGKGSFKTAWEKNFLALPFIKIQWGFGYQTSKYWKHFALKLDRFIKKEYLITFYV